MARSVYARTWELSKRLKEGAERPMDYIRAVDDYLHGPSSATSSARRNPAAAARRSTTSSTTPTRATASTSRARWRCCCGWAASPRASRPASRPAATRRATRPGSCATPTPTRGSRSGSTTSAGSRSTRRRTRPRPARRSPRSPRRRRARRSFPTAARRGDRRGRAGRATRSPSARICRSASAAAQPAADGGRPGRAGAGFERSASAVLVLAAALAVLLFLRRPRGKTPMDRAIAEVEAAMRRVGRPVTTGTTLGQLEGRLGSHSPEVAAYLRSLATGRYGLEWVPPPRSGRRALRRALAQGLGIFGGRARVVGDAAALRAPAPRAALARVRGRDERSRLARSRSPRLGSSPRRTCSIEGGARFERVRSSAVRVRAQTITRDRAARGVFRVTVAGRK